MYSVLCLISTLLIQEIKVHHALMVQMLCSVDTVDIVVYATFTQMYTDTVYCIYTPCPSKTEGSLKPPVLWVYRFTTKQSEEAALLTFWDLSNYKGNSRQDAQPIRNS